MSTFARRLKIHLSWQIISIRRRCGVRVRGTLLPPTNTANTEIPRLPFSLAAAIVTSTTSRTSTAVGRQTPHRLPCLSEESRHEQRHCLLRWTVSAAKCPSVCFQVRSPVAGDVSCPDAAGLLRKRNPRRHSAISAQATSVGDELHCSAGVRSIVVRPHHSTPAPTALVEFQMSELISSSLSLFTSASTEQHRRTLPTD